VCDILTGQHGQTLLTEKTMKNPLRMAKWNLLMSKLNPKQQSLSGIGENHESKIVQ
jgi:hypothetical protein